jgi:hypothetical protein
MTDLTWALTLISAFVVVALLLRAAGSRPTAREPARVRRLPRR